VPVARRFRCTWDHTSKEIQVTWYAEFSRKLVSSPYSISVARCSAVLMRLTVHCSTATVAPTVPTSIVAHIEEVAGPSSVIAFTSANWAELQERERLM